MIKVRFAPSPTGFLHLGSARTALFNWLYAKRTGGEFVLRIEDTDQSRSEQRFLDEILEDLKWLGIGWDSEPICQSTRFDLYREKAEGILKEGKAYKEGEAIIFKVEKGREIVLNDLIHGKIVFNTDDIKDQVMIKSDGSPAYNFCCVVDDADMEITHIIRGDDHISNTPKQMLFYEAIGVTPPEFGHMPLMMGADGAKLSKRHGGVSVEEYKKEGFLPEAMINYLLLLGWSPGGDREIISLDEAVKTFEIKNMSDVQSKFDVQKLRWMDGEYIMASSTEKLLPLVRSYTEKAEVDTEAVSDEKLSELIDLYKMRMKTLSEFPIMTDWFFKDDFLVDEKGQRKYLDNDENKETLKLFAEQLDGVEDFSKEKIEELCRSLAEEKSLKPAQLIHPTRMAISGKTGGAGLFEIMALLGKDKVIERMGKAAN